MTGSEHRPAGWPVRDGFTIIEIIVVLVIIGVMALVAIPNLSDTLTKQKAQNAQNDVMYVATRAQMSAVERGEMVRLSLNPSTDVLTTIAASGDTLEVFDMQSEDDAALVIPYGTLHVCYSPLGFAHPSCGDGSDLPVVVGVSVGAYTLWSVMSATGAVRAQ